MQNTKKNDQAGIETIKEEFEQKLAEAFVRATGADPDDIYETMTDGAYDWWTNEDDGRSWIGGVVLGDLSGVESTEELMAIAAAAVEEFAGQQEEEAHHWCYLNYEGEWVHPTTPWGAKLNYAIKMRAFAEEIRRAA